MKLQSTTITFIVGDPQASGKFLEENFGFETRLSFDGGAGVEHPDGGPTLIFLQQGLTNLPATQRNNVASEVSIALTVHDIQSEFARLAKGGLPALSEVTKDEWGEYYVQYVDPNGLVVQLVQWEGQRPY